MPNQECFTVEDDEPSLTIIVPGRILVLNYGINSDDSKKQYQTITNLSDDDSN